MKLLLSVLLLNTVLFANIKLPENFKADFTQTITNTKKKVIEYQGNVHFSDERLFKWSYTEPTKKEFVPMDLNCLWLIMI